MSFWQEVQHQVALLVLHHRPTSRVVTVGNSKNKPLQLRKTRVNSLAKHYYNCTVSREQREVRITGPN